MQFDQYQPDDILSAFPDAIAARIFGSLPRNPHPLAEEMAAQPLSILADAIDSKSGRPGIRAAGIASPELSTALAIGVQEIVTRRFFAAAEHRKFCNEIELQDFRPVSLPSLDMADELPRYYEAMEPRFARSDLKIGEGVQNVQVATFERRLAITRQAIKNDDVGLLSDLIANLANAAARTESRILYQALESNPVLADGPTFIENANWIKSALDETSLGAGIAMMRTFQTDSGNNADIPAAFLVVAPGLELSARKIVHQAGLPLEVLASANLAVGHWYLVSDPAIHPACSTLRLRGGTKKPVLIESASTISADAVHLSASADLGATVRGRLGIVRGEPA